MTGKYLAVKCVGVSGESGDAVTGDSKQKTLVCLLDSGEASRGSTAFCFSTNTVSGLVSLTNIILILCTCSSVLFILYVLRLGKVQSLFIKLC